MKKHYHSLQNVLNSFSGLRHLRQGAVEQAGAGQAPDAAHQREALQVRLSGLQRGLHAGRATQKVRSLIHDFKRYFDDFVSVVKYLLIIVNR